MIDMPAMLMRTDPFRELDRLTQQVLGGTGTPTRPSVMPMDAWRDGDTFHVEFDLPGVAPDCIDLDVERNVVTVRAERAALDRDTEMLAAERPRGVFSRQLVLGDNLDTERIDASYEAGALRLINPRRGKGQAPQDPHRRPRQRPHSHHRLRPGVHRDGNPVGHRIRARARHERG